MSNVPTNLIPTRITQLPEYVGTSTLGYMPYVIDGRTFKVQFTNIAAVGAVPSTRVIATGDGLEGGGDLSQDRTLSIIPHGVGYSQLDFTGAIAGTYGSADTIPAVTIDATGRVLSIVDTPVVLANYVPTSRTVAAGAGLTGGGQLNNDITLALDPSNATPQPLGAASAGIGLLAAREDHVHPAVDLTDTTETQGVLPLGRGGTGDAISPVVGAVIYADNDSLNQTVAGNAGQLLTSAGGAGAPFWQTLVAGSGIVISQGSGTITIDASGGGTGTVTSVSGTGTVNGISLTGTVTTSGSLTLGGTLSGVDLTTQVTGTLPVANGGTGQTTYTDGQLLIGSSTGNTLAKATLTAGSGITITNGPGSITIDATGGGTGTVTSVGLSGGTTGLTATSSTTNPITSSGTFTLGGTLAIANGGTNGSAVPTAGGVAYGTGTAYAVNAAGPAGYVLTSGGTAPPVWTPVASLAVGTEAYWGSFWDTTTQTAATANTAYALTLNSADVENNGVTIVTGSRVTFIHAGVYSLTFSAQLANTDNSNTAHIANIWIRKNGVDVPASDSKFTVPGKFGTLQGAVIGTVNFVLPLAASDYIELIWSTNDTSLAVASFPAGTTPVSPVVPSIIFTAVAAAPVGLGYAGVESLTSLTVGTGSRTFTVNTNATDTAFIVGNRVRLVNSSVNYMDGVITAYSGTSMTVLVDGTAGSGTYTAWFVTLTGSVGGVTSFSGNSTGLTPSTPTAGDIALAGTLNVANGGTGQTTYTDGQLLIGNSTGNTLAKATLSAGTNVSITNGAGAITINATDQFVGTVTSVGGTGTVNGITLTGTVTSSGSLTLGGTLSGVSLTTQVSGTLPVANGGTGVTTSTGTGSVVLSNTPTLVTPILGAATATSIALPNSISLTNPSAETLLINAAAATATMRFRVAGDDRITITAAGDVGIGTSAPAGRLEVSGGDLGLRGGKLFIGPTVGGNGACAIRGTLSGVLGSMIFQTENSSAVLTDVMTLDSSGNLGIGTSAPAYRLDVKPAAFAAGTALAPAINITTANSAGSGNTSQGALTWQTPGGTRVASINPSFDDPSATFRTSMAFSTSDLGGTNTERMRITSDGNVGINNTPSGTYKLEVTGAAYASSMVLGAALPVASGGTGVTTSTGTGSTVLSTAPALSGATLNDGYTEEVFAVTGTTPALSPTNGSIQTWTLTASSTPTAGTWADGQSMTLMINDGTAYTVTWTSLAVTWKTDGGVAPTLNLTGFTVIQLWKVGSVIYGARVGNA